MHTIRLRSLMRRYGVFGLLFVGAYSAVCTLWKRGLGPKWPAVIRGIAVIGVVVISLSSLPILFADQHPRSESEFIAAIQENRFREAIWMLEEGANPNAVDHSSDPCVISQTTALELAVAADQKPLVISLFRHHIHLTSETEASVLAIAAHLEKKDMFQLLLAHGLRFNAQGGNNYSAALMQVNEGKDAVRAANRLLDAGADVNRVDSGGGTVLMFASLGGDLPMVRLLLERGADPTWKDDQGASALSWAKKFQYTEIVALLKQHGAQE